MLRFRAFSVLIICTLSSFLSFSQCTTCLVHITPGQPDTLCNTQKLDWAKWTSVSTTTATGTISSGITISVTMSSGGLFTTGAMFSGNLFPAQYNIPISSTSIANSLAGVFTFCFDKPVTNPQIALASIGNPSTSVQVNTSVPYCIIWQGVNMSYPSDTTFIGTEGYTIIRFPGTYTCISFDYQEPEYYCNIAFGIQDTSCQTASPIICPGGSSTLTASGGNSYSWSPSAGLNIDTGSMVIATPLVTTKYFVTDGNCTDSVLITVDPFLVVAPSDTAVCSGSLVQLNASGGATYKWSPTTGLSDPNISNPEAVPTQTTSYTVTVSPMACNDDSTATLTITVFPFPSTPVINQSNDTLFFNTDSTYSSCQWYSNDTLVPGAADTFFVALRSGNYNVAVIDKNGCEISAGINIILGEQEYLSDNFIFVSPNPVTNKLTIHPTGWPSNGVNSSSFQNEALTVSIMNVLGQLFDCAQSAVAREAKRSQSFTIDVSKLPAGMYFLQLKGESIGVVKKFVKE